MFKIQLFFYSGTTVELVRVEVSNGIHPNITTIRGKTSGAYNGAGTFQWSSAVKAVAAIFLRAKLEEELPTRGAMLSGEARSLAASLDYALAKGPVWLLDMFGVSANGLPTARRLFKVSNSHRKRIGPVSISLNLQACPPAQIEIFLDERVVSTFDVLRGIVADIESHYLSTRSTLKGITERFPGPRESAQGTPEREPAMVNGAW